MSIDLRPNRLAADQVAESVIHRSALVARKKYIVKAVRHCTRDMCSFEIATATDSDLGWLIQTEMSDLYGR